MKLVLDTQIWIDWLFFANPSTAFLDVLQASGATILMDAPCAAELERVMLTYPLGKHAPDADGRAERLRRAMQIASPSEKTSDRSDRAALPRCADADDQKFLELAREAGADFLVTRDQALLDLARHAGLPFRIVTVAGLAAALVALRLRGGAGAYPFGTFLFEESKATELAKTLRRVVRRLEAAKSERKLPLHAIVLVPSLAQAALPQGDALWKAAAQAGAYLYVLDPPELVRLVDAAAALARDSGKIDPMVAFDFLLLERFNAALAVKESRA